MAHHKNKTKVNTCGTEIRLRRDRRGSRSALTKSSRYYNFDLPNPDPDGGKPTIAWVLCQYPMERKGRRERALEKRKERRKILKKEKLKALTEGKNE